MKTRHIIRLLAVAVIFMLGACTRHNGDIGPYFGTWKVASITIDGLDDTDYDGTLFFKFQSDVICMTVVNGVEHTREDYWGRWSEDGSVLTIDFTYGDRYTPAATGQYAPPPESHLPSGVTRLEILSFSSSRMKLRYDSPEGEVYEYSLVKW